MSNKTLTEEQREKIRQGVIKFYNSEAGAERIKQLKSVPPWNKGLPGPEPWNKGKKGLYSPSPETLKRISNTRRRKVIEQYSKSGEFIRQWPSLHDASRELGIAVSSICRCCKGQIKACGGYQWQNIKKM